MFSESAARTLPSTKRAKENDVSGAAGPSCSEKADHQRGQKAYADVGKRDRVRSARLRHGVQVRTLCLVTKAMVCLLCVSQRDSRAVFACTMF